SLLEVGTGFHPELTGRENIYLNGAILGMRKGEIERKFEEIVAFAEVEKFMDTPVKRYSSGMFVRLAFAVAAHLEPEVLLVDEVLAVGDAQFQQKCLGKMDEVSRAGRTVLLVSHNMAAIESLCKRAILLDSGYLRMFSSAAEVVSAHLFRPADTRDLLSTANERTGSGKARVCSISYRDRARRTINTVRCGDYLRIEIEYALFAPLIAPVFRMTLYSNRGVPVANFDSEASGVVRAASSTRSRVICEVDSLNLSPGRYHLNVGIGDAVGLVDHVVQQAPLTIEVSDFLGSGKLPAPQAGLVVFRPRWGFEELGGPLC
ncbi:MAG: ABC transporter ATP-binding protein, partial [Planctomycetes bacterium]|nr:ABC transporter ATP-binding protein [Planctomycetota bacterium]